MNSQISVVSCLPSTLDIDTIYAQVDNASSPGEIQSLWIAGLEFVGGGGDDDTPKLTSPVGTTIYFNGSSTKTITVKGKNLTGAVNLAVTGAFTVTDGNGNTVSSISPIDGVINAQLTLTKGSGFTAGTLAISSATSEFVAKTFDVTDTQGYQVITAIKLTGTQYFDLGYKPNPNTKFELDVKFEKNTISDSTTAANNCCVFLSAPEESGKFFIFQTGYGNITLYSLMAYTNTTNPFVQHNYGNESTFCARGLMEYSNGSLKFLGYRQSPATMSHTCTQSLLLGFGTNKSKIFDVFNMYVYGLKIYEGSTLLHDFKPVTYQGTPGLLDDVNDTFISSESGTDPIAVE